MTLQEEQRAESDPPTCLDAGEVDAGQDDVPAIVWGWVPPVPLLCSAGWECGEPDAALMAIEGTQSWPMMSV
jgi:hypothetical protein